MLTPPDLSAPQWKKNIISRFITCIRDNYQPLFNDSPFIKSYCVYN